MSAPGRRGYDNHKIVGMLLEKGADYKQRNHNGQTPLFFAKPETARKFGLHREPVAY